MLMTTTAILAAAAVFPVAVRVSACGKQTEGVCTDRHELEDLIRKSGFRNSIDHASVERVN